MIAKNYIKHPDALRVQRELFFIGYRNSPLLMRLIGVIMDQRPAVPEWFKKAREAAKALAKKVKNSIGLLLTMKGKICIPFPYVEKKKTTNAFNPVLHAEPEDQDQMAYMGIYRTYSQQKGFGKNRRPVNCWNKDYNFKD